MDALMAALVAALLAQASDRAPWVAAGAARQSGRPGAVIAGAVLALVIINALGAAAGALMAPILTPNARSLLLAFALLSAGFSAFFPIKRVKEANPSRLGAGAAAFVVLLAAGMGDRTQFLTAAIAARGDQPVFAAIGAVLGATAVQAAAVLAGDALREGPPARMARIAIGALLAAAGVAALLSAFRLI